MNILKQYQSVHSPKRLYEAWISEKTVIPAITKIESQAQNGGDYILYSESPRGTAIMRGKFIDLIAEQRIEYTWHWEGSDEHTLIIVSFEREADHTKVEIRHQGFMSKESLEMHDAGWDAYFEALNQML